ncbi:unnamed protein product [Gongylonema pulchrum]|uniref:Uncharacterized protein n=1 Tax=Gongylonema pulchrum TaxID=637853 RepID=A0A3P6T5R7_9BILA|nr:unnamed protein product [Gongylonema pulchrum]
MQIASKHNLRLGPHNIETVLNQKQRYLRDESGPGGGSLSSEWTSSPRKVVFTTKPTPEVHINSAR